MAINRGQILRYLIFNLKMVFLVEYLLGAAKYMYSINLIGQLNSEAKKATAKTHNAPKPIPLKAQSKSQ